MAIGRIPLRVLVAADLAIDAYIRATDRIASAIAEGVAAVLAAVDFFLPRQHREGGHEHGS